MRKFTVSADFESETATYYEDDYLGTLPLTDDLTEALYSNPILRDEYKDAHAEDLTGYTADEIDSAFYDFCVFSAETAVADAVNDGSARVFDLEIVAIDDEDPSAFSWYFHDADAGEYHAIRRQSKPARGYRAALEIDPETGDPRTYSGLLPTKAAALAVLHHLAPEAVELPGLPAWLR